MIFFLVKDGRSNYVLLSTGSNLHNHFVVVILLLGFDRISFAD